MSTATALVTGASGFIGANLVGRLLADGHTVHALVRPGSKPWRLHGVASLLQLHGGDLRDAALVAKIVAAVRPDVVYHLATHGAYERQSEARRILETNVLGTLHLLEACERHGTQLFVSAGSSSEYGFKTEPMRETDLLQPNSYYAVAKATQTHLCQLAARRGKVATVVLRLFSVYGPWEDPGRLVPTLIRRARAGQPLEMVAPDVARDFVYVDDVVDAMLDVAALQRQAGQVFNLGSGVQTTLAEVVAAVRALLSSSSEVRWGALAARAWDTSCWVCDPARARQQLGWSARTTLVEGLGRMAAWMQAVGDRYGPELDVGA